MAPGIFFFACASLAVIRAKRQRAGVEEQERESAAHSGKWEDVTAPLGFGLPGGKHRLIGSNLCLMFLFMCTLMS